MTRVDFYMVAGSDDTARWRFVARLAEKAHGARQAVFIYSPDRAQLEQLDDMLWAYRADSFLPHSLAPAVGQSADANAPGNHEPVPDDEPIVLSDQEPTTPRAVLINLALEVPPFFSRFQRTLEVINQDPAVRQSGRVRYTFYRQRGYPLQHHDLSSR